MEIHTPEPVAAVLVSSYNTLLIRVSTGSIDRERWVLERLHSPGDRGGDVQVPQFQLAGEVHERGGENDQATADLDGQQAETVPIRSITRPAIGLRSILDRKENNVTRGT